MKASNAAREAPQVTQRRLQPRVVNTAVMGCRHQEWNGTLVQKSRRPSTVETI